MEREKESLVLRVLKWLAGRAIGLSLRHPKPILLGAVAAVAVAIGLLMGLERDFLPPFNEGSVQLNVVLPPGTSLRKSNEIAGAVEQRLMQVEDVTGNLVRLAQ